MDQDWPLYKAGFWMLVGFNEETAKLLVLLLLSFPTRHLREPFDGILHGAVVALGLQHWKMASIFSSTEWALGNSGCGHPSSSRLHERALGYFVAKLVFVNFRSRCCSRHSLITGRLADCCCAPRNLISCSLSASPSGPTHRLR